MVTRRKKVVSKRAKRLGPKALPLPGTKGIKMLAGLAPLLVTVDRVKPDPANPRRLKDLPKLVASIKRFGVRKPLVVNSRDDVIEAGHQTFAALLELGATSVPVLWSDDSRVDATAYNVADNRTAEVVAEWDEYGLVKIFESWHEYEGGDPFDGVGFTSDDMAKMIAESFAGASGDIEEDEVPEPPKRAVTKLGDVWHLGQHTLICGDTTDLATQELALGGLTPKMIFADPPYNVGYSGSATKRRARKILNDKMGDVEWRDFCRQVAALCVNVTDGCIYVCHASGPSGRIMARELDAVLRWSGTIVWVKGSPTLSGAAYQRRYEPIWFGWPHKHNKTFTKARNNNDAWEFARPACSEDHPTIKPLALVARAIEHASAEGDLVFDPFSGSGTGMIACEKLGRRCVAIELDPIYCDVAVKRWKNLTGKAAKRTKRTRKSK